MQQMPGVGPVTAMAMAAFAPPMDSFRQGRDFSAWLGLVPRQHSSGGKQRLGRTSQSGQRDIRRLLIIGAMAVISGARIRPPAESSWLGRILARKPRMMAAIALANSERSPPLMEWMAPAPGIAMCHIGCCHMNP
ncbi:IS110 family transposase [Sinirhodobacter populi]|uniref:IS110 family transposase n=1 Tax=Paenirhodobacter populi TaxID=2306993 RepID=A0A443JXF0_9RHOB|nr:IS110 family transposase [Sinirhodobacter populi]